MRCDKGNKIRTKSQIASLNARNLRLLESLSGAAKNKTTEELRLTIENDLVSKFWIG